MYSDDDGLLTKTDEVQPVNSGMEGQIETPENRIEKLLVSLGEKEQHIQKLNRDIQNIEIEQKQYKLKLMSLDKNEKPSLLDRLKSICEEIAQEQEKYLATQIEKEKLNIELEKYKLLLVEKENENNKLLFLLEDSNNKIKNLSSSNKLLNDENYLLQDEKKLLLDEKEILEKIIVKKEMEIFSKKN